MILLNTLKMVVQYITEGFIEIFSPDYEQYPAIGVQPYSGTINHHSRFDW
ncbi:MAG: hypothetical protein AAGE84_25170 [Cyanobacteria bacterium P01_G01_bin.39]